MSKLLRSITVIAASLTALVASIGQAGAPTDVQIHRPSGEYRHAWLTFEGADQPIKAFVAFRDGESSTVWFLGGQVPGGVKISGSYQLLVDTHKLSLKGDALKGTIDLRQVSIWAPMARLAEVKLSIDAKRAGDAIAGTWTANRGDGKSASGSLTGSLTDEASLKSRQAFDPASNWPSYHGPFGTNRGIPSKTPLVDDLNQARPVWKSEQRLLSGWGTGVDSRYKHRAAVGMVCGGSGSPIAADGRIYLFHFEPSGDPDPKLLDEALAAFEMNFKRKPDEIERRELTNYARPRADTIVTCLDARTGEILWRVTFPRMSGNIQTHKWRGFNPTATLIGPALIANDYAGNWVALDAVKGSVLWTRKRGDKISGDQAALGAVAAGKVAILPGSGGDKSRGVDPATGNVLWEEPGGPQAHVFGKPGEERVVLLGNLKGPIVRDAATGKELYQIAEPLAGGSASSGLVAGDILVGSIPAADKKQGGHFQGWKLSDTGAKKLWQDEFLPLDENLSVTILDGKAYLVGRDEIRCLDAATGKVLAQRRYEPDLANPKNFGIGSNQWLGVVGDRLFLSPEGQHGRQSLVMLDAKTLEPVGGRWVPPNNTTTAYGRMSIAFPVVDGRVIVRGADGLYCYDLRKN